METSRRQALALTGGLAAAGATLSAALDVLAQADPTASGPTATSSVRYGAAVYDSELFHDAAFRALYARHCQVIVPGYFLKWESLHPARDRYDWANADASVALGKQLNAAVRGHTLVWHESMPKWALEISSTADAEKQLVTHIETVVARYRGTIRSWDVVNEPLHETASNANHYRPSVWYRHLGERYLEVAFRTAAAVDPGCQLVLNEYGIETTLRADRAKRQAYLGLLQRLRDKGVPVHAVGIQCHISAEQAIDKDGLAAFVAQIKAMGLATLITELEMIDTRLPADVAVRDNLCAARTYELLDTIFSVTRPAEVITWGLSDRRIWVPAWFKRPDGLANRHMPFDIDFQPKPMWRVIEYFCGRKA